MKVVKIEQPFATFGTWSVYKDGSLKGMYKGVNGKESLITIYPDRLTESNLLQETINSKLTSDLGGFVQAWYLGLRLIGIKNLNIQIDYE